jgi:hypothetical protein
MASHPFDEIKEIQKRAEAHKQEHERLARQKEQAKQAAAARFEEEKAKYAGLINQVLDEFGRAVWGDRTERGGGPLGFLSEREVRNYQFEPFESPEKPTRFRKTASVNDYYVELVPDELGNVMTFSVGWSELVQQYDGLVKHDRVVVQLPAAATKRELEQALVTCYKAHLEALRIRMDDL